MQLIIYIGHIAGQGLEDDISHVYFIITSHREKGPLRNCIYYPMDVVRRIF